MLGVPSLSLETTVNECFQLFRIGLHSMPGDHLTKELDWYAPEMAFVFIKF